MSECTTGRKYVPVREESVRWLMEHFPALCEKSGLCERIAGRLYIRTTLSQTERLAVEADRTAEIKDTKGAAP